MTKDKKEPQSVEQKLFAGLAKTKLFPIDQQPLSAEPADQVGSTSEIRTMKRHNIPITLKNWLDFIYPDGVPDEWQQEADVPQELREEFKKAY